MSKALERSIRSSPAKPTLSIVALQVSKNVRGVYCVLSLFRKPRSRGDRKQSAMGITCSYMSRCKILETEESAVIGL